MGVHPQCNSAEGKGRVHSHRPSMEPLSPDGETQNHKLGCSSLLPGTSRGSLMKPGIRAPQSCSVCLPPSSGLKQMNERFEGHLGAPSSDTDRPSHM